MNEFFTWTYLATFAGAAAATTLLTQFVKGALSKVPTQVVSYGVALIVLALATAATGAATGWAEWSLVPFNAVLVSLTSNGVFDAGTRMSGGD